MIKDDTSQIQMFNYYLAVHSECFSFLIKMFSEKVKTEYKNIKAISIAYLDFFLITQ